MYNILSALNNLPLIPIIFYLQRICILSIQVRTQLVKIRFYASSWIFSSIMKYREEGVQMH